MKSKALAAREIALLVIAVFVLGVIAYTVYSVYIVGESRLDVETCKNFMKTSCQLCIACIDDPATSANECLCKLIGPLYKEFRSGPRIQECRDELRVAGITIKTNGSFDRTECTKIGIV